MNGMNEWDGWMGWMNGMDNACKVPVNLQFSFWGERKCSASAKEVCVVLLTSKGRYPTQTNGMSFYPLSNAFMLWLRSQPQLGDKLIFIYYFTITVFTICLLHNVDEMVIISLNYCSFIKFLEKLKHWKILLY